MHKIIYFFILLSLLSACSRKTVPTKEGKKIATPPKMITTKDTATTILPNKPTSTTFNAVAIIVIDANGKIVTPADKLPANAQVHADYTTIARAFTPEQKANLNFRYKMIPPKVIYVSDIYTQKSAKGIYCIYKKRFWYWKKQDGLFYLDEVYYK